MSDQKKTRIRAEKMKFTDGVMLRYCSECETYLPLESFGLRAPRARVGAPAESGKYQSYCRPCATDRSNAARARRKASAISETA